MKSSKRGSSQISNPNVNLRTIRVALFGGNKVGKSAIAKQFVYNEFDTEEELSMIELYQRQMVINGETLIFEILDTNQDLNSPIVEQHFTGFDGYLLVFSLLDMNSLAMIGETRLKIRQARNKHDNFEDVFHIPMVLIGNKKDLLGDQPISKEILEFAESFSMPLIMTSAWTGEGIQEAFTEIMSEIDKHNGINLMDKKQKREGSLLSKKYLSRIKCNIL